MDRDRELRIAGHLYEIERVNEEVLATRQGFPTARRAYEKTLEHVAKCADDTHVDELANYIKRYIKDKEERPRNRALRRRARRDISRAGYPADDYLNSA